MSEEHERHRLKFMLRQQAHAADLNMTEWLKVIAGGTHPNRLDTLISSALQRVAAGDYVSCMSDVRFAYGNSPVSEGVHYSRHTFAFALIAQAQKREMAENDCFLAVSERKATEADVNRQVNSPMGKCLDDLAEALSTNEFLNNLTLGVTELVRHVGEIVIEYGMRPFAFSVSEGGATLVILHLSGDSSEPPEDRVVITITYHMKHLYDLQTMVEQVFDEHGNLRQN